MGVLYPLLPFGLSSPVPKGLHSSHHAGLTFRLLKKVCLLHSHNQAENCTHREPGTGGGIRHSQIIARVYLSSRRCSALRGTRRDLQAWAMLAHGASLAERRVVPSLNEKVVNQARPERVHVRNRVFIPSSNGRGVCSSTHAHVSRYTENRNALGQ